MMNLQQNLHQALQLFQQGQYVAADQILRNLLALYPEQVDCLHLRALTNKALGQWDVALPLFEAALKQVPQNTQILANYANTLVTAGMPEAAINQFEQIIALEPHNAMAWEWLGSLSREVKKLVRSEEAYDRVTQLRPDHAAAWINLAVIRRLLGNTAGAVPCLDNAETLGFSGPELMDCRASHLIDKGQIDAAIAAYKGLCQRHPDYMPAFEALTKLLWENYPDDDPLSFLSQASDHQPDNIALKLLYIKFLLSAKKWQPAKAAVQRLGPAIHQGLSAHLSARALEGLGEDEAAYGRYLEALKYAPDDMAMRQSFCHFLLKTGRVEEMLPQADTLLERNRNDQITWAYLGTAWRLLGDKREDWLHQYDELIKPLEVDIPDTYESREAFCEALKAALLPMHASVHEPIDQSLNHGTQTGGHLFGFPTGVIKEARDAIRRTVNAYQAGLPYDPEHPFLSRKAQDIYFQGAWSVRLKASGWHKNHVHSEGWLSSAFYVDLPPSVRSGEGQDGWIQFGQPLHTLGLDLAPRRTIQPHIGTIAVFPSYTWHGTVPFSDDHPRITMAFDMVPC